MSYPIVIVAHNIRSLWNIGSIFRSADGFGVSHIHLTGYTGCPTRKEITKTALGADEWIPWSKEPDPHVVIEQRRSQGYEIVSLEKNARSTDINKYRQKGPLCLILGHEVLGISEDILAISDAIVHIEMVGKKESFNVAVAAGIALFSLRRTR